MHLDLHIDGEYSLTVEKLVPEQYPEFLKPDTKFVNSRQQEPKRKLKFCHQLDYATSMCTHKMVSYF